MNIDHWAEPDFQECDNPHAFVEESNFKLPFPEYRSQYIQDVWPQIKTILNNKHLKVDLDVVNKLMTVATTSKTRDPYIIIKGRDMLKLVARSVPVHQAKRILQADVYCEIIKIGGIVRNNERFARRRQRLIGPNGSTLKVIELLTNCYVCVSGQTVSAIGHWRGVKRVREIALDCMNNIHPIYHLKTLMVRQELSKDPNMQGVDWERYLPHFKKKGKSRQHQKSRTTTKSKSKSE